MCYDIYVKKAETGKIRPLQNSACTGRPVDAQVFPAGNAAGRNCKEEAL